MAKITIFGLAGAQVLQAKPSLEILTRHSISLLIQRILLFKKQFPLFEKS
jgi:hypothetical protein